MTSIKVEVAGSDVIRRKSTSQGSAPVHSQKNSNNLHPAVQK